MPSSVTASTPASWSSAGASAALAAATSLLSTLYGYAPSTSGLQTRALALLRTPTLYPLYSSPRPSQRAIVRIGRDAQGRRHLCDGEREVIQRRQPHVRAHMARFLAGTVGAPADSAADAASAADPSLPVLALCCSGGGFRATLSALGSLRGMQRSGLWDSSSYIAGLSGATWAMGLIYANEEVRQKAQANAAAANAAAAAAGTTLPPDPFPLSSPVEFGQLCQEASQRLSSNLFTGVPLDFIKAAALDRWGLHMAEEAAQKAGEQGRRAVQGVSEVVETAMHSAAQAATNPSMTLDSTQLASTATSALSSTANAAVATAKLAPVSLSTVASLVASMGLSDPFGWCIAHKLLEPLPKKGTKGVSFVEDAAAASAVSLAAPSPRIAPRLSDQASLLSSPSISLPYPLYASITRTAEQLELTPHEVGHAKAEGFIPTWALGRTFDKGREVRASDQLWEEPTTQADAALQQQTTSSNGTAAAASSAVDAPVVAPSHTPPEPPLAFLLSCFASAHPTRIGRMLEELIYTAAASRREPLLKIIHSVLHETLGIGHESAFSPAQVPSFLYRLDQSTSHEDIKERTKHIPPSLLRSKHLTLMDAGLSFNLPFPPLLSPARCIDLIVALDASSPPEALRADAVRLAAEHAERNGLKFPALERSVQFELEGEEKEVEARAQRRLEGVSFSSSSAASNPAAAVPPATERDILSSLSRASSSVISVFPGDLSRGIPTLIYMPLIANKSFVPGEEYQRHMASTAAIAGAQQPTINPAATPLTAAAVPFDPRANFVSGGFCATLNFQYHPWQSGVIMDLSEHNARRSQPVIRAVIRRIREEKKRRMEQATQTGGSDHNATPSA